MIFVTVGTHEQPFNRLIEYIDNLKKDNKIEDEVMMQIGFSTYEPKYCEWSRLLPYKEMLQKVEDARIVITHGGPASFIMPLQVQKTPIVVPRQKEYDEHVNNHQIDFCREVFKRQKNIIVIEDICQLEKVILNYELMIDKIPKKVQSHNENFNKQLESIVEKMFLNDNMKGNKDRRTCK